MTQHLYQDVRLDRIEAAYRAAVTRQRALQERPAPAARARGVDAAINRSREAQLRIADGWRAEFHSRHTGSNT